MQKYSDRRIGVKSFFHETLTGFHGHSLHSSAVASSPPHSPHRVHYQPPRKQVRTARHPSHADSTLHRSPRLHEDQRRVSVVIDRAEWLFSLGTPSPRRTDAARHG